MNVFGAFWVLLCACITLGFDSPQTGADEQPGGISAIAILNKASQIATRQDMQQLSWRESYLFQIADIQMRAHDFDGAKNTIKRCGKSIGRNAAFIKLAETHAAAGQRVPAFEVLHELGTDHGWTQDYVEDGVRMLWLEYLIAADKLESAQTAVDEMVVPKYRSEALCKLALAHARLGDKTVAKRLFRDALISSTGLSGKVDHVPDVASLSDEYLRAIAVCEVAQAQCKVVDFETTSSMIQELVQHAESSKSGLAKVGYQREAAVLAAKIGDQKTAKALFRKAIESRHAIRPPTPCPAANRIVALYEIAKAQASVGFIGDAIKTAAMIKNGESERGKALCDIAVAQARGGDVTGGIATANSIINDIQFKNDALLLIVDLYIGKGDKESALMTAKKIVNPSRKAAAILKVATQYARDGDKSKAKAIAGQIQLKKAAPNLLLIGDEVIASFDFTKAETWGVVFDQGSYFSSRSYFFNINRAAELAAAAMTLHQAFDEPQDRDYAVVFQDVHKDAIQSLACAHAEYGDAKDAIAWASRIGSDEKMESENDHESQVLVERRIHALIGVAEGLLARQARLKPMESKSN